MDPAFVIAITSISAIGVGILSKILYQLRHNVKSCWGVVFRSTSTSRNSPRGNELNNVRKHFENTLPSSELSTHITPRRAFSENSSPQNQPSKTELEQSIKIKELENRLKQLGYDDPDLVYI